MTETKPILREQAKGWQKHLWNWWRSLEDASALVTISLLSPKPIYPDIY